MWAGPTFGSSDTCTIQSDQPIDDVVLEDSMKAAINFVQVACQQSAYIAGRGSLAEEIQRFKSM